MAMAAGNCNAVILNEIKLEMQPRKAWGFEKV